MECIIGPPVSGPNFVGRTHDLEQIRSAITKGGSVMIMGPRRYGKTSIIQELKRLTTNDFRLHYVDVESVTAIPDFIIDVVEKIYDTADIKSKILGIITGIRNSVEDLEIAGIRVRLREELSSDWQKKGNEIFQNISENSDKIVIALDELPIMLMNIRDSDPLDGTLKVRLFMQWLRQVRNRFKIQFMICGSIGLNQILYECQCTSSVNDLFPVVIRPFDNEIARTLIYKLFESYNLPVEEEIVTEIISELGSPVPYFIQLFVNAIVSHIRQTNSRLDVPTVHLVYNDRLLGIEGKFYFDYYFDRLAIYYKQDLNKVRHLLNHLALNGPSSNSDLLKEYNMISRSNDKIGYTDLVNRLENDFYIVKTDEGKLNFHAKILKDFWKRRFGL